MTSQDSHPFFPTSFIAEHQELFLYDAFHQSQAHLLYPSCTCEQSCVCTSRREQILLSLNTVFYNRLEAEGAHQGYLQAARFVLAIPDDHFFRKHSTEIYPIWLIEQEFQKRTQENHFQMVSRLLWALVHLANTASGQASLRSALQEILGGSP